MFCSEANDLLGHPSLPCSDYKSFNQGFRATWKLQYTGRSSPALKSPSCHPTEFSCANGQCANWSDVCDGLSDCGCAHQASNCDEDPYYCTKARTLPKYAAILIGVAVGIVCFLLLLLGMHLEERGVHKAIAERLKRPAVELWRRWVRWREARRFAGLLDEPQDDRRQSSQTDTGKLVAIMVAPSHADRSPRYSIVAIDEVRGAGKSV